MDKWVVGTESVREPHHAAESEYDAYVWAQKHIAEEPRFVVYVNERLASGLEYLCLAHQMQV